MRSCPDWRNSGEYISILEDYQKHSLYEIKGDHTLRAAVERYLEISIESTGYGEMIISM